MKCLDCSDDARIKGRCTKHYKLEWQRANPDKQRAYQRGWLAGRKQAWFAGKSCVDCGATEKLELDHRDREQKVSHNIWSWSDERRVAEIDKCIVLCDDCHLAAHGQGRSKGNRYSHGSQLLLDLARAT